MKRLQDVVGEYELTQGNLDKEMKRYVSSIEGTFCTLKETLFVTEQKLKSQIKQFYENETQELSQNKLEINKEKETIQTEMKLLE